MKLLLHVCCAPCLTACLPALEEEISLYLYWYNFNIHPFTEYRSRRDSLVAFAKENNLNLIDNDDEYGLRKFIRVVFNTVKTSPDSELFAAGKRCQFCYRFRLEKTARLAAEKGYDAFSTTLLASPYQRHDLIKQTGEEFAAMYGIDFLYRDFRPLFREGQYRARAAGCYMQKYCGCIFSEEERYRVKNDG